MAQKAILPITISSPPIEGECTSSLYVEYRETGALGWQLLNGIGYTTDNPVVIQPLNDGTNYQYKITRNCCNGQQSVKEGTFTTP